MPSAFPAKMFPKSEHCDLDNYKLQVEILQQKLAKSEEKRTQLEEKYETIQKKRSEHEKSIRSRSRAKFEEFLEQQKERNERNKKIVLMLEQIDQQAAKLSQKSRRLRSMKRQYELYFARLMQSQAFRVTATPQYTYIPMNQIAGLPTDQIPALDSIAKESQTISGLLSPNINSTTENFAKQNIPSIVQIPATPPNALSPRANIQLQPQIASFTPGTWGYLIPNQNAASLQSSGLIGNALPFQYRNNFAFSPQPNPYDFYNSANLFNPTNTYQGLSSTDRTIPTAPLDTWSSPSSSINKNFYTDNLMNPNNDIEFRRSQSKADSNELPDSMTSSQKSTQGNASNQRTFKDFDRRNSIHSNRNNSANHKSLSDPASNDYDFSKATEDDLKLLRGLSSRSRLTTFNNSNENLSQNEYHPELYERRDTSEEPNVRNRSPSRYSLSRSPSVEESKYISPDKRSSKSEEIYNPDDTRNGTQKSPSDGITTSFSNLNISNRNNVNDERANSFNRDTSNDNIRRPQQISNITEPLDEREYNAYNDKLNSSGRSSISDKSGPSHTNTNSSHSSPSISTPSFVNNESSNEMSTMAERKQRPAFLKKIQLPEYLSHKMQAEKSSPTHFERPDTDTSKLYHSPATVSSPLQFARKEKLTLENIENAIYGELINPDMPVGGSDGVAQILRQHQTPAEIIAETNQGRRHTPEINRPKLTDLKDIPSPISIPNNAEKAELNDAIRRNKIEVPEKTLNMTSEKIQTEEQTNASKLPDEAPPQEINMIKSSSSLEPSFVGSNDKKEASPSSYSDYEVPEAKPEPIYSNDSATAELSETGKQKTFDYDTQNSEGYQTQPVEQTVIASNSVTDPELYANEAMPIESHLEAPTYPETQQYADASDPKNTMYQPEQQQDATQQQYDTQQDYQQYDQQGYDTQDPQNTYENYPTDGNNYQTEYDPNAYNYNYDQQQPQQPQADGTYANYDPNQQYAEQDYTQQQQQYQDPNYSDQQYAPQAYAEDPNVAQVDPNAPYDYSEPNIQSEGFDSNQQQSISQEVTNPTEPVVEQQPETPQPPSTAQPGASASKGKPASSKAVKPILTKEKSVDLEKKKKKVNFVDSSDDSSSKAQPIQPTTTDESDFDFSSQ